MATSKSQYRRLKEQGVASGGKRKARGSTSRPPPIECTYEKNPACGYISSHTAMCYCCNKAAVGHIMTPFKWCGNGCEQHLKMLGDKHRGSVVEKRLVVIDIKGV